MPIKFKGDMSKVVAKNKGDMSKTTLRKRASIIQQIINGTATVTPAADYYTKMLLHFDDSITSSNGGTMSSVTAPWSGVLSKDGTKVYMGANQTAGLYVIDAATNVLTKTITSPGKNFHLVVNSTGSRVYGANNGTGGVNIFDTSTDTLLSTIATSMSNVRSLAITPNDKFLFAGDATNGLYRIDLTAATPSATLLGNNLTWGTYGLVISPDGTKLLTSTGSDVKIYALDQVTGAITLSSTLTGFSAYYSAGTASAAYYTDATNGGITPVFFSTSTKGSTITTGAGPSDPTVSPDGKKLYVSNATANTVTVIDTTVNVVVNTLTGFTAPRGGAATNSKLFVANNTANSVSVVDVRTFADAAQSPLTQSRVGTVLTSTTQSKFGGKSLALNGNSGNKLQFANPKGLKIQLGESDWTMEGWFWFNQTNIGYQPLFSFGNDDANHPGPQIYIESNSTLTYNYSNSAYRLPTSFSPNANQWYHIAVSKNDTSIKMFVDGTQVGGTLTTPKLVSTPNYLFLGVFAHAKNLTHFNGYIDGIRIQVGESLYNSNFTAPTSAPVANSYTKLLMNFDSTIKDESTSRLYSYAVGTTAVVSSAQSKFGGSSLKMSGGTTDYVKIHNESQPIAFLDRPFTIEGWFYKSGSGFQPILTFGSADGQGPAITMGTYIAANISTNGTSWTNNITTTTVPPLNTWNHFALVRESKGGNIKLYHNGILAGSTTITSEIFTGEVITPGHYPGYTLNGYIDEVRITLDYCAYNGNFTPPTAPFTLIG